MSDRFCHAFNSEVDTYSVVKKKYRVSFAEVPLILKLISRFKTLARMFIKVWVGVSVKP